MNMRILIVEDDLDAASFLAKALGESGHIVDTAADGEEALGIASDVHDVLIVDRMMPKLDGLALVEKLRDMGSVTPVLFLSALGKVDDRVAGLKAGATIIWLSRSRWRNCWQGSKRWAAARAHLKRKQC